MAADGDRPLTVLVEYRYAQPGVVPVEHKLSSRMPKALILVARCSTVVEIIHSVRDACPHPLSEDTFVQLWYCHRTFACMLQVSTEAHFAHLYEHLLLTGE